MRTDSLLKRHDVAIVTPNASLATLCERVCRELDLRLPILTGDLEAGVEQARRAVQEGTDVIISRGGTALAIQHSLPNVPVVEIRVTAIELLRAIRQARQNLHADRMVAVGCKQFTDGFQEWNDLLQVSPLFLTLDALGLADEAHVASLLQDARAKGYDFVVGDTVSTRVAKKLGMQSILVESGPEAVVQAVTEAVRLATLRAAERDRTQHIRCIADHAYEGIISIDKEGIVQIFNPSAEKILGIPASHVVGRKMEDSLEGFKLRPENANEETESRIIVVRGRTVAAHVVRVDGGQTSSHTIVTFQEAAVIEKVEHEIRRSLHARGLVAEYTFDDIVGRSHAIQKVKQEALEYAESDSTVCIIGETGTGKELFAQAIHNASWRRKRPFVAFNCAAFPETLQESELFGYAEGAFTGAKKGGKAGLFEQAHGGSIFLDEIDALSGGAQALMLRVLQDQKVRRIGDDRVIPVDVRLIIATNEDLGALLVQKRFRNDLYYRISVLNLRIPPLRERPEDIPLLVEHFSHSLSAGVKVKLLRVAPDGIAQLQEYTWPGNIRQLKNIVERIATKTKTAEAYALQVREAIAAEPDSRFLWEMGPSPGSDGSKGGHFLRIPWNTRIEEIEKLVIDQAVASCDGNRAQAAEQLGISRTTLWRRMRSGTQ